MRLPLLPPLFLLAFALSTDGAQRARDPAPLRAAPHVAWSFAGLALEGAPLVTGARVLVHGRDPSGRRALVALEADSGRVLARTLFAVATPLDPVVAGEHVLVRAGPGRLELLRWRGVRFVSERSFQSEDTLSRPAFADQELVLRDGDALLCHELARREPRWRTGPELVLRGTPAFLGEDVLALAYDARGEPRLVRLARADGRLLDSLSLGPSGSPFPAQSAPAEVLAHETQLFVRLAAPVPGRSGDAYEWTRVALEDGRFGTPTLHHFQAQPLALGAGWIAPVADLDGGTRWIRAPENHELAAATHHAWLARARTPAAAAGDVAYLGGGAAELGSHVVLWRRAELPEFRPMPLDGRLLVVEGGILRCLAGPEAAADPAVARAREHARAGEAALAQRLLELGAQALRANDVPRASTWLDEAEALGVTGRALELARAEVERARARTNPPQADARKLAALRSEEQRARAVLLARLLDEARAARGAERHALLAELLARDPTHADALAFLAELLPAGARLAPHEAAGWLAYLRASERLALDFSDDPAAPAADGSRLGTERAGWRADAQLFTSPGLALVTAGTSPGDVALALRTGEHVAAFLARVFGPPRRAAGRLDVVLYPTRAEYLAENAEGAGGLQGSLDWTAGHFDLAENVSRLYVPYEGAEQERLLAVQAHELTHHWLAARSSVGPVRAARETPGHWIVEGIALWVEERAYDAEHGFAGERRPQADSLDTVAAEGAPLLPWRHLLALSYEQVLALETRPTAELPLAWRLGTRTSRSPMQFFYAQAGALAHWLWESDGGAHRELLLEVVRGYYAGAPLDLARATGLAPDELGARVQAFARAAREP